MTQNNHGISTRVILSRKKDPAKQRPDAEQGEKSGRNARPNDLLRLTETRKALSGKVAGIKLGEGDIFKDRILLAPIQERRQAILAGFPSCVSRTSTSRSGSEYGNGRNTIAFRTLNMEVFVPMPSPRVSRATKVNRGLFSNMRIA